MKCPTEGAERSNATSWIVRNHRCKYSDWRQKIQEENKRRWTLKGLTCFVEDHYPIKILLHGVFPLKLIYIFVFLYSIDITYFMYHWQQMCLNLCIHLATSNHYSGWKPEIKHNILHSSIIHTIWCYFIFPDGFYSRIFVSRIFWQEVMKDVSQIIIDTQ